MSLRRPLLLSGPPGVGKSALAPALAARLGVERVDLDQLIAQRAGLPVPELIRARGEPAFRAIERELLSELIARGAPSVVALGGGALTSVALRRRALREATVVALDAREATLQARVAQSGARPLLVSMRELLDARREGYAEAHATLSTEEGSIEALADQVAAIARGPAPLVVPLGTRSYRVYFAPIAEFGGVGARELQGVSAALGVTDTRVASRCGWMRASLPPVRGEWVALRPGERAKTLHGAARLWSEALSRGIDRDGVVLCHGGGVVSDLGGFVAATLLRGVRYATAPTTLLAMVDASVGGKTAVDHLLGKNLVGAFHHPSLVWVDVASLETLPRRELLSGMAEVIKIAAVCDLELLSMLERDVAALASGRDREAIERVARRAVQAKIDVVAEDERERGRRALLNFGHTVGHALEAASGYRLRHGECVAVGSRAALALGVSLGVTPREAAARVSALLDALGYPRRVRVDPEAAAGALSHDKKRAGGALRFALVTGPGAGAMVGVERAMALEALAGVIETR